MRRVLLTILFCAGASAALWNWSGSSEYVTLFVCALCVISVAALATYLSPRQAPQHWGDKDIRSYAITDGIQFGLLVGITLGTDSHIRAGRGLLGIVGASGFLALLAASLFAWGRRSVLRDQRDEAQLAGGDVFE